MTAPLVCLDIVSVMARAAARANPGLLTSHYEFMMAVRCVITAPKRIPSHGGERVN